MAPRPILRPLVTPKTMLFPSELNDRPMTPAPLSPKSPGDGDRTAITPPPAYTEFLNALTPVFASPAGSDFPRSPLDKSSSSSYYRSSSSRSHSSSTSPPATAVKSSFPTSYYCDRRGSSKTSPGYLAPPPPTAPIKRSISPSRVPYPSRHLPYPTPTSASATSSATFLSSHAYAPSPTATHSPRSASVYSISARSPYSYSASDWKARALESPRSAGGPRSAKPSPLGLRHVVTRTVTYRPGPAPALHPPPRGKRRKNAKYLME